MNVFGRRLATSLYIFYTEGRGGERRTPGARRTGRPNMRDQNAKSNLIRMEFGIREFTRSLITNLNPPTHIDKNSDIQNGR